ncbi:MAG: PfkB protein [Paenibacillaceae bacterium]|jgi:2-dehydro-3-deoxygluconokinase|nr:PfkB protein [Paenibacillaceae bacterium]
MVSGQIERRESPEVVTFGETMGSLMPTSPKGVEYTPHMSLLFGGAESNVAIGLARMGVSVGWCGRLGRDPLGRMIFKRIRGEGVDVSRAELTAEAPTGLMIREVVSGRSSVYYYRRNSAASAMKPEHLDEAYIGGARVLHVTGITPALSESCKETVLAAIRMAKKAGVKVCFDPNLRLKLWSIEEARQVLLDLAGEADYFLPGWDELVLLYETEDYAEIIERLGRLAAVSIVKGRGETTLVVEDGWVTEVPFYKVDKIVDPVGAGDAFCAGFISGVVEGLSNVESARLGNLLGSLVIQYEGDWEGIPTRDEVDAILHQVKHVER